jgi:hypothetical protein
MRTGRGHQTGGPAAGGGLPADRGQRIALVALARSGVRQADGLVGLRAVNLQVGSARIELARGARSSRPERAGPHGARGVNGGEAVSSGVVISIDVMSDGRPSPDSLSCLPR